jgi:hypothetical protein
MRPLAGSLTAFSAAQAVSLAAGLLLHATAARFLTVADYGRLAVTHSVLLVMLVALNHGIPNALRRAVSLEPALLSGIGSAVATTVMLQSGGLPGAAAGLLVGSILGVVFSGAALHRIVGRLWPTMPFMNRVSPKREDHSGPEEDS